MQRKARIIAITGVLAALTCAATMVVRVPSPSGGYMNLGDTLVLLSAWLLGPWYGAAAAGIGSALADLIGYPLYAPATLLIKGGMPRFFMAGTNIKGGMAIIAGLLLRKGRSRLLPALPAEALMVAGYWVFDGMLTGSLLGAAAGIPSNLVQAGFGIAAFWLLSTALSRSSAVQKEFPAIQR